MEQGDTGTQQQNRTYARKVNRQTDRDRGEDTHLNRHKLITNRTQVQNKGRKKTKGGNKREKHDT